MAILILPPHPDKEGIREEDGGCSAGRIEPYVAVQGCLVNNVFNNWCGSPSTRFTPYLHTEFSLEPLNKSQVGIIGIGFRCCFECKVVRLMQM